MYNGKVMIWSNPLFVPLASIGCFLILLVYIIYLQVKIKRFLRGKDAKSLEDSIVGALEDIKKIHNFQRESVSYFEDVEKRLNRSIQAVETIRFNPFKGTGEGGNQSFSVAILDEDDNGVVVTGLYSREGNRIYAKPIKNGNSSFQLSEEECCRGG